MPTDTDTLTSLPFLLLWTAVGLSLFQKIKPATVTALLSIASALAVELLQIQALIPLALAASTVVGVVLCHNRNRYGFWIFLLATAMVCFGLGVHGFGGFNNQPIVQNAIVSPGAMPFTLYWNYDKACAAFFLILLYQAIAERKPFHSVDLKKGLFALLITLGGTVALAYTIGLIRWEPKIPVFFISWILSNLFITAAAEEGFFRGLIQYRLYKTLSSITHHAGALSIVIAGTVFGIAHMAMGYTYVVAAIVAGIGYGLVFHVTKRLEFSILTHFLLNTMHILFFTYPMLESAQ